jgi:hypothetical protein
MSYSSIAQLYYSLSTRDHLLHDTNDPVSCMSAYAFPMSPHGVRQLGLFIGKSLGCQILVPVTSSPLNGFSQF